MARTKHVAKIYGRLGGKDECGGCRRADSLFKTARPERVEYKGHVHVNSPEGKQAVKKHKIERIPFIEYCVMKADGTQGRCRRFEGFDERYWSKRI